MAEVYTMRLIKFIVAILILAALVAFAAPKQTSLQREISINASIDEVFDVVNNMRRFNEWSPWHSLDPDTEYQFEGPDSGTGAFMSWESDNSNVGSGSQLITSSTAPSHVELSLDFGEQGTAEAEYILSQEDGVTTVIWGFESVNEGLVAKLFGLITPLFLGPVYEQGLENLKTSIETAH